MSTIIGNKVEQKDISFDSDELVIIIPKGMPYVKVRRALEFAALRVK